MGNFNDHHDLPHGPAPSTKAETSILDPWRHGAALQALQGVNLGPDSVGDKLLNQIGIAFRRWCRIKKIDVPPATWNMHLIGRGENDSKNSYPVVDSNVKAAHTKPMVFYLSELATEISMLRPSNSFDFWKCFLHHPSISHTGRCKVFVFFSISHVAFQGNECNLRAKALWGMADFLWATDRPQLHLEQDLQLRAVTAGQTCLDSYSHLCFINFTNKRLNYKLRPKWLHNQIWCFFWTYI